MVDRRTDMEWVGIAIAVHMEVVLLVVLLGVLVVVLI